MKCSGGCGYALSARGDSRPLAVCRHHICLACFNIHQACPTCGATSDEDGDALVDLELVAMLITRISTSEAPVAQLAETKIPEDVSVDGSTCSACGVPTGDCSCSRVGLVSCYVCVSSAARSICVKDTRPLIISTINLLSVNLILPSHACAVAHVQLLSAIAAVLSPGTAITILRIFTLLTSLLKMKLLNYLIL